MKLSLNIRRSEAYLQNCQTELSDDNYPGVRNKIRAVKVLLESLTQDDAPQLRGNYSILSLTDATTLIDLIVQAYSDESYISYLHKKGLPIPAELQHLSQAIIAAKSEKERMVIQDNVDNHNIEQG